jgi:multidrug efflux pump subunit AcrA (membrane-fusion protein)
MYADVTFDLEQKNNALVIPAAAVIQGDQPSVLIVDSTNHVARKRIVLGIASANQQEVTSGLNPGDRVVIGGITTLQPGQVVTPQEASSKLTEFQSANQKGGQ